MKKLWLMIVMFTCLATASEDPRHAIGFRRSSGNFDPSENGKGFEIAYMEYTGPDTRLDVTVGICDRFGVAVIYKWNRNITGGVNWFAGPGGQIRMLSEKSGIFSFGIGGQGGIEYDFNDADIPLPDWPIIISIDTRPMWGARQDRDAGFTFDWAWSVRYTF